MEPFIGYCDAHKKYSAFVTVNGNVVNSARRSSRAGVAIKVQPLRA